MNAHRDKSLLALYKMHIKRWLHHTKEFINDNALWQKRIKDIEANFGSGTASFFTFVRLLFDVNFAMFILQLAFVGVPGLIHYAPFGAAERHVRHLFGHGIATLRITRSLLNGIAYHQWCSSIQK